MKQKLEEVARKELVLSHSIVVDRGGFKELLFNECAMLNMFYKGAEWQTKQSPWISIDDSFPEDNAEILRTCDIAGKYVRIN